MHEQTLLDHDVVRYDALRVGGTLEAPDDPWMFRLSNPEDVEDFWYNQRAVGEITKMALARQIQRRDAMTVAQRYELWSLSKDALLAALAGGGAPVLDAPAPGDAAAADADAAGGARGGGVKGRGRARRGRGGGRG